MTVTPLLGESASVASCSLCPRRCISSPHTPRAVASGTARLSRGLLKRFQKTVSAVRVLACACVRVCVLVAAGRAVPPTVVAAAPLLRCALSRMRDDAAACSLQLVTALLLLVLGCARAEAPAAPPTGLSSEQLETLAAGRKLDYKAEVKQLMHLIINSIYSNVEVFLRELISNGSDALDKIRILSLTNRSELSDEPDLSIRVRVDPERRELHIIDTGVGMTAEELTNNLGTIAKSGTKEFAKAAAEGDAQSLIGQFGVGFYSAFLVADRVTVASKHNNDSVQHVWQSDAAQNFVVAADPRGNTLKRGTHITLHLKDSQLDFASESKIKELIEKYSEFISFPIYLWTSKNETEEVPLTVNENGPMSCCAAR